MALLLLLDGTGLAYVSFGVMPHDSENVLLARATTAIVESRQLVAIRHELLAEMIAIYERRMICAMKAVRGVHDTEQKLVERYRQLTHGGSAGEPPANDLPLSSTAATIP